MNTAMDLIRKGSRFRILWGSDVRIWHDPWAPNATNCLPVPNPASTEDITSSYHWVFKLIHQELMSRNTGILTSIFENAILNNILTIRLPQELASDQLRWASRTNGEHSSKEAYLEDQKTRFPTSSHLSLSHWKALWKTKIHKRLKLLQWKIIWNILPIAYVIGSRIRIEQRSCYFCQQGRETLEHLLFSCLFSQIICRICTCLFRSIHRGP